ncbi:MAG: hypothetical protein LBL46_02955 [Rickettsiales bacterium]|jgi:hypothetical protein|nr:hypothetical protein [Rickettsiales bacterium]
MKRISAFLFFLPVAAFASCPSGYVEVDVGNLYQVVETGSCPSGYVEIDTSLKMPSLSDTCDPSKGTCIGSCTYTP